MTHCSLCLSTFNWGLGVSMYCPQPLENHGLIEKKKDEDDRCSHTFMIFLMTVLAWSISHVCGENRLHDASQTSQPPHPSSHCSLIPLSFHIHCHPVHQSWTRLLSYCFSTSVSVSDLFLILFYYLFSVRFLLCLRTACLPCMHLVHLRQWYCSAWAAVHFTAYVCQWPW